MVVGSGSGSRNSNDDDNCNSIDEKLKGTIQDFFTICSHGNWNNVQSN